MKRSWSAVLSVLLALLLLSPVSALASSHVPDCSETASWTSVRQVAHSGFADPITNLRAGRQDCFDRLVVDFDGSAAGYFVGYVKEVTLGGSGFVVPLRGGAKLEIIVLAPGHDGDFNPTYDPPNPDEAVDVSGFETFRQVAWGFSFESESVIGLGVRERLPFRVLSLEAPGRLVIDVAHSWTGQAFPSSNPFGNFESATGVAGGIDVKGWMIDPDQAGPIYAWITVDGVGRHLFANLGRPDVGAAFPTYGPNHGFRSTIPAAAGAHTVCVTASNVWAGSHSSLGCRRVTVPDRSPVGNFESAVGVPGGVDVKGWMIDPDTPDPIYAWVTVDGVGRHLFANQNRPDVGAAFPAFGPNHGFRGTLSASPGAHRVCVTAANVGPGAHKSLGCRLVTVPNTSPFGNFESARGVFGAGIEVKGWMIDPDTPDPIYAWVTVDGVGRHLFANQNRPDVGAAFPAFGPNHGFRGIVPAGPGAHTVCVTASNVGPGSHTPLGCRRVGLYDQPFIWPAAHVVFTTPEAAAADFVTRFLGVPANLGPFLQGDSLSGEMDVLFGEGGGTPVVRSTLLLRRPATENAWFVLGAVNPNAEIASPSTSTQVPRGPLTVEGSARGFEGLVVVEAFLAGRTSLLDQELTTGGSAATPEPYSVSLDLSGAQPGDVVTLLVRGGVGHEDDPGDFSAIPVVVVP